MDNWPVAPTAPGLSVPAAPPPAKILAGRGVDRNADAIGIGAGTGGANDDLARPGAEINTVFELEGGFVDRGFEALEGDDEVVGSIESGGGCDGRAVRIRVAAEDPFETVADAVTIGVGIEAGIHPAETVAGDGPGVVSG